MSHELEAGSAGVRESGHVFIVYVAVKWRQNTLHVCTMMKNKCSGRDDYNIK